MLHRMMVSVALVSAMAVSAFADDYEVSSGRQATTVKNTPPPKAPPPQQTQKEPANTETYTVHTSGDAHGGVPTYSTGGLNPNPQKKKDDKAK